MHNEGTDGFPLTCEPDAGSEMKLQFTGKFLQFFRDEPITRVSISHLKKYSK